MNCNKIGQIMYALLLINGTKLLRKDDIRQARDERVAEMTLKSYKWESVQLKCF